MDPQSSWGGAGCTTVYPGCDITVKSQNHPSPLVTSFVLAGQEPELALVDQKAVYTLEKDTSPYESIETLKVVPSNIQGHVFVGISSPGEHVNSTQAAIQTLLIPTSLTLSMLKGPNVNERMIESCCCRADSTYRLRRLPITLKLKATTKNKLKVTVTKSTTTPPRGLQSPRTLERHTGSFKIRSEES